MIGKPIAIAVDARKQALRKNLKEVVGLKIGLIHRLAQAVHCLWAIAGENEIVGVDLSTQQIHAAQVRRVLIPLQAADDRLAEVWPKPGRTDRARAVNRCGEQDGSWGTGIFG